MNNNNSTRRSPSCGNVSRGRKRKVLGVGHDEDDEHHHNQQEMVARSNSGAHQMRLGSGINHESRIVRVSRSSGGKDRHSKVLTAKGLRDRRVRLSVSTAIQFYDLQDRLRLDQPSKAVEWLLKAASHAIDELPVLDHPFHGTFSNAPPQLTQDTNTITITKVGDAAGGVNVFAESSSARGMSSNNDSPSSKEGHQGQCELIQSQQKQPQTKTAFGKGKMTSSKSSIEEEDDDEQGEEEDQDRTTKDTYYSALSLSRSESSCLKERERSKKTAKESFQFQIPATAGADPAVQNQDGDNDGARDSFTGLLHSVAHVALDSRDTDHNNNRDFAQRRRTTSLSMNILHHNPSNSHTHALSPTSNPPSLDHLFHDQPQAPHILHSASLMQPHSYGSQSFAFPTYVNAAIFSPLSLQRNEVSKPSGIFCTSEQQKHHLGGSTAHFTTIPNIQQQQQHPSFVDQEEQNVVPITSHDHMNMMTFSMPGLSGRETLQSNSYNTMAYHMAQRIQPVEASMFTTARNVHMQGGFDNRVLQRSMQDLESESSGSPAFKVTTKLEDHYK